MEGEDEEKEGDLPVAFPFTSAAGVSEDAVEEKAAEEEEKDGDDGDDGEDIKKEEDLRAAMEVGDSPTT